MGKAAEWSYDEYYSAVKRNKLLTPTTRWMNLKTMLKERSQTKEYMNVTTLIQTSKKARLTYDDRVEKCLPGAKGREVGINCTKGLLKDNFQKRIKS